MKKMIKCKCCGAEIAPDAERCPHCGKATPSYNAAKFIEGVAKFIEEFITGILLAPFMVILIIIAISFYVGLFSGLK